MQSKHYVGNTALNDSNLQVEGGFVKIEGEEFYKISGAQHMLPFFISIVSDSDHWMFISSNGALTAGRKNPENALFPYYTVDKIHDAYHTTGSKTIIKVHKAGKTYLWEPFSDQYEGVYQVHRNLYKNVIGNRLIFEEINLDLQLSFSYSWNNSNKFGFIRKSSIKNLSIDNQSIELLDGIQNILPYGVNRHMQTSMSVLVDAYKKSELIAETGLGIYVLSSIPVDKAEPSEALKATTVWSVGENITKRLISSVQLSDYRKGKAIEQETDMRAKRGAYFVNISHDLTAGNSKHWYIIAEINQNHAKVAEINKLLKENKTIESVLEEDIAKGSENLHKLVATADGLQLSNDRLTSNRQFANVMFNIMRGGIFDNGYTISRNDFSAFIQKSNPELFAQVKDKIAALPEQTHHKDFIQTLEQYNNADLYRLGLEYMPLTFSRRHGDPSRPWNLFSIETRKEDGSKNLDYQGNWRDIFQNWEALSLSFPGFIESMISKFVNASTADGYNPYRVTRDGFDWEIQDPHDPWSFIGYWGDHQIIYLLKFLEVSAKYSPGALEKLLDKEIFAYANVPYRIKPYQSLLANPYASIDYDFDLEKVISGRIRQKGSDGKLIWDKHNQIYYVNLTEKLLVSMLAKLANYVPEGGIWMNTQRPEWNDANNALTGYGISMVTLYYLRRFLSFCKQLYTNSMLQEISISEEVGAFLNSVNTTFASHTHLLQGSFSDKNRKAVLDGVGEAASLYRSKIYTQGFSNRKTKLPKTELIKFFDVALQHIDHAISANKRPDKLFHAYNVLSIKADEVTISHMYEMLEGQVAVLSSGYLSADETLDLLDALKSSAMFRADQYSYLLYPDRNLPRFTEKNSIPATVISQSVLLKKLLTDGDKTLVEKDIEGVYHFNGNFTNKFVLNETLDKLTKSGYGPLVEKERQTILDVYEDMFNHKAFTGRSGTFFGYEGLGCIYWHMVSKLLLCVEEACTNAAFAGADEKTVAKLKEHYYDIRKGLGLNKTPQEYGSFPTDPYSHTPGKGGAQQPGMTGQVKEDIISRFGELGLFVRNGCIELNDLLLRKEEFLSSAGSFEYYDISGKLSQLPINAGSLAFTFCQVPFVMTRSDKQSIILYKAGKKEEVPGLQLDSSNSNLIFERKGVIDKVEILVK